MKWNEQSFTDKVLTVMMWVIPVFGLVGMGFALYLFYDYIEDNDFKDEFCASKNMEFDFSSYPQNCFTSSNGELVTYYFTQKEIEEFKEAQKQ